MRVVIVACLLCLLCNHVSTQSHDDSSALNENPCLDGEPFASQILPEYYPNTIQLTPPGYMARQTFDDQPTGRPAPVFRTPTGYRMIIAGITGEWGFSAEFAGSGCLELAVEGDFYIELADMFIDDPYAYVLGATLWGDDGPAIDLEDRPILDAGGSTGERWVFYVDGEPRQFDFYVRVAARSTDAGPWSVIEWRRIAIEPVESRICARRGVPVYAQSNAEEDPPPTPQDNRSQQAA